MLNLRWQYNYKLKAAYIHVSMEIIRQPVYMTKLYAHMLLVNFKRAQQRSNPIDCGACMYVFLMLSP
jgi:hypothetical protein